MQWTLGRRGPWYVARVIQSDEPLAGHLRGWSGGRGGALAAVLAALVGACREAGNPPPGDGAVGSSRTVVGPAAPVMGFPVDEGMGEVVSTCTACHSGKLVQQNRATKQGWLEMIRWMQAEHKLWPLDPTLEDRITTYLGKHYGPDEDATGRRPPLAAHLMPPTEEELRTRTRPGN